MNNLCYRTLLLSVSIIFFSLSQVHSQNPTIESLEKKLTKHTLIDTAKVNLLNNLASKLYTVDRNRAKAYADQSLSMAKELKYHKGEAESLWVTGLTLTSQDQKQALDYFKQALAIAEKIGDRTGTCNYLLAIGTVTMNLGDSKESERIFDKALKIASTLEDQTLHIKLLNNVSINLTRKGEYTEAITKIHQLIDVATKVEDNVMLAKGYFHIANIFARQGHAPLALEYYYSSLRINEKLNNRNSIFNNLLNIAIIKAGQKEYKAALETLNRASLIAQQSNDSIMISSCLTNIGNIYANMKNPNALNYLKMAQKMLKGRVISQDINLLLNIGMIYIEQGRFDQAELNLKQALEIAQKTEMKSANCEALIHLAKLSHAQKRYADAIKFTNDAIQLSRRINYLECQKDGCKSLADNYAAMGNYQAALENYKSYKQLNDSIFNEKNVRKIALLESTYKYEKDKQKHELAQQMNESQIQRQRSYIVALILVIILISLFSYQLYISIKLKKRAMKLEVDLAKSELEYSQKQIASATLRLVQDSERDEYCLKVLNKITNDSPKERDESINSLISYYKNKSAFSNWNEFELLFMQVNAEFYQNLSNRFPTLTLNEKKLCVFLKLNMTSKDIAKITFQSEEALKKARLRLRKKMELERSDNLSSFIQTI